SPARAAARRAAVAAHGIRDPLRPLPPLLRRSKHRVMSEVEVKRSDRDVTFLNGSEIGSLLARPRDRAPTNPIDLPPPRILHWLERVRVDSPAEARQSDPSDVIATKRRQVNVQQRALWKRRQRKDVLEKTAQ